MAGLEQLVQIIYHERQQEGSNLCAQHALNSLLRMCLITYCSMLVFIDFCSPFPEGNYVGILLSVGNRILTCVIAKVLSSRSLGIRSEDGRAGAVIAV
jgi:hypothetical protein